MSYLHYKRSIASTSAACSSSASSSDAAPLHGKIADTADTNIDNITMMENFTSHFNRRPSHNLPLEAAIHANHTADNLISESSGAAMEKNSDSITYAPTTAAMAAIGDEMIQSRSYAHNIDQSRRNSKDFTTSTHNGYASMSASHAGSSKGRIFLSSLSAEESEQQRQRIQIHDRNKSNMKAKHDRSLQASLRDVVKTFDQKHDLDENTSELSPSLPSHHSRFPTQTSHHHNQYSSRPNLFSSSSGSDDGGYAGSASSNDVSGGSSATSCSSPSFYEDQRYIHNHNGKDLEDQVRASGGISCNNHDHADDTLLSDSKRSSKRMKRNVSFSSDIADFSSSSTSLQHYYDETGRDRASANAYGELVGTKTTGLSSDESGSDGEDCNFRLQTQKRRAQLKKPREQTKQKQRKIQHQQQPMDTSVPMTKLKQGRKRRNVEGRCSLMSTHSNSFTKISQGCGAMSSTTTTSCNSNSTFSLPSKRIEDQQHKDLKATFQSALKQLDHNFTCSNKNIQSFPSSIDSAHCSTAAAEQQANPCINAELRQDSNNCSSNSNEMYAMSSTTSSSTQQHQVTRANTHSVIYDMGTDVMANIMSYLEPEAVHTILGMPLSKTWRSAFTVPQDLWKVLCLSPPFHAKFDGDVRHDQDIDKSWYDSHNLRNPVCSNLEVRRLLGHYRVLYSSFIKCMRYLNRIKEDVLNNRTPMGIEDCRRDNGITNNMTETSSHPFNGNLKLNNFFAKAREVKQRGHDQDIPENYECGVKRKEARSYVGVEVISRRDQAEKAKGKPLVRFGHSKLTQRLLGPVHASGVAGDVNLPTSCAIYSVVNWMVAFTDVAGIQNMCLKTLPNLLEDEKQRTSAQHAGLTDIVLRAMVLFPCITELHTAAFHTLVLLARPLGGKEGMLFHRSMVNSSGIFNVGSNTGKSGIAVMLDSMKRFSSDEDLQAMGCWSMVNIALIPSQKVVLVKLGGISIAVNALMQHPHSAEVHFRALFALINLVIPSENLPEKSPEATTIQKQVEGINETSEKDMLDESVVQIANLVVVSMKNFWSSEAILNRACLVLHNLSLNEGYHRVLLWTPNCYQMLEWCIGNYRHDAVLQQSAGGTLQRLQMTLANDVDLRQKFTESIRVQQQIIS